MLVAAALAANLFLSTFGGTWTCTGAGRLPSRWTIAPAPASRWVRVEWNAGGARGTAYVGYLAAAGAWIYEDFHADGSFATSTSPGPAGGVWTWSATYTTGARVTHGAIQWRREGTGMRQRFGRLVGTTFVASGTAAACRPAP
jgi:hypothetical protein